MTIIGYTDLPSRLAKQSSTLYATNLFRLAEELCKTKDGVINVNMEDEVIRGTTVIKEGDDHVAAAAAEAVRRAASRRQAGRACRAEPQGPRRTARARRCRRKTLAIVFGVGALLFCSSALRAAGVPRRTSRCSCSRASSATWWSGT